MANPAKGPPPPPPPSMRCVTPRQDSGAKKDVRSEGLVEGVINFRQVPALSRRLVVTAFLGGAGVCSVPLRGHLPTGTYLRTCIGTLLGTFNMQSRFYQSIATYSLAASVSAPRSQWEMAGVIHVSVHEEEKKLSTVPFRAGRVERKSQSLDDAPYVLPH
ncbi:hypothetical protein MAPG_03476 [Magnaporthiopsis poae ATCC 64411]|uniref:Uncharacterized protein n=1 Tax=Magnaporthiopsis poae (strain ATCC 64411 / 73-15) TaxID=644358 RepID=A0A0C4DU43_MAGP6|nr:hypothetical protein MAPG_03476 [Magnaporthiopsis poae ATCC 64411]